MKAYVIVSTDDGEHQQLYSRIAYTTEKQCLKAIRKEEEQVNFLDMALLIVEMDVKQEDNADAKKAYIITDITYEPINRTVYQSKAQAKIAVYKQESQIDSDLLDLGMEGLMIVELEIKE